MWIYIVSAELKIVINIAFNSIVTFMCVLLTYSNVNTCNTCMSLLCIYVCMICMNVSEDTFSMLACILYLVWEGIKPGTNAWNPGPKSGTKFCQQNIAIKHACIKLKFGWNVDYRLFFEMHISICLHLPYFYYMQMKYRTMSWNTDPGPTFSVLTMSRNS